tara:strand:- start:72943 stop:74172 length:1230 start_codon:yes stop_codon:yes gene_type:complete
MAVMLLVGLTAVLPAAVAQEQPISLQLTDTPLAPALELLARDQGLVLAMDAHMIESQSRINLTVEQGTLPQVLQALLTPYGLDYRLSGNVLQIGEADELLEQDEISRQRNEALQPVMTRYIQINYADAPALLDLIAGDGRTGMLSGRGNVQLDARTNTLVVRDTQTRIAAIDVLLTELDVPVSQVLIEARIVSASLESGRELGLRWGIAAAPQESVRAADVQLQMGQRDAGSLQLGIVRNRRLLEWELSMLESQGQAELIARPRVMTQDNSPASIRSGVRIPYQAQAGGTAGGSITEFVDAVLSLEVTPLITPDGRIIMSLDIRQDSVASGSGDVPAINTNTVATRVLIDNADTLVLGGIFREEQTETEVGTPVLRQLPLLGGLFRRTVNAARRTELLIFIIPQIVPDP